MGRRYPRPAGYHWDEKEAITRPAGLMPCRWCKGPVAPPKRNWCGDPVCVWEWQRRVSWGLTRQAVIEGDHGRCVKCGFDGIRAQSRFAAALAEALGPCQAKATLTGRALIAIDPASRKARTYHPVPIPADLVERFATETGQPANAFRPNGHLLEVDHIRAIHDGGDPFDFANLQTLCVKCHREKTTAYHVARKRVEVPCGQAGRKRKRKRK